MGVLLLLGLASLCVALAISLYLFVLLWPLLPRR